MHQRVLHPPGLIYQIGTRVVARVDIVAPNGRVQHPNGSVGVVVGCPVPTEVTYRIRFLDGYEESLHPDQLAMLAGMKQDAIGNTDISAAQCKTSMASFVKHRVGKLFGIKHSGRVRRLP